MHAVQLTGPSFDALKRIELPEPPHPGPGRIIVSMKAASLNFADVAVITGNYPGVPFPIIPLADGAGEVVAVGEGVWQVRLGDRVITSPKSEWSAGAPAAELASRMRGATIPGSLQQYADLSAASVVKAPDHLNWSELASLPIAAMTAWRALSTASVGPSSTVVALGTGGVSIFTLQLAKALGARVVITSSSDAKLQRARALGADVLINYRDTPEWHEALLAATDNQGADFIIDPVGGEGMQKTLAAVRHGGHISLVGFLGGAGGNLDLLHVIFEEIRVQGSNGGSVADLSAAISVIDKHKIHPVVDRTFHVDELQSAYQMMMSGGHFGKIALDLNW